MANINRKHPLMYGNEDDRRGVDDSTATDPTQEADDNNGRDVFTTVYMYMGNQVPDPNSSTSGSEITLNNFFMANGDDGDDLEDDLFQGTVDTGGNLTIDKPFYPNLRGPEVCNNITGIVKESENFGERNGQCSFEFAPTSTSYFINEGERPDNHGGNERHYYEDKRDYLADMAIMKEIQVMLTQSFGRNNRGFFYVMRGRLANILGRTKFSKQNWDTRIERICNITGFPRNLLNIIVEAKANVTGPITFVREQEEIFVTAVIDGVQHDIKVIRLREEINMANGVHLLGHLFVNDALGVDSNNVHFRARVSRVAIPRFVLFVESEETARIIRSSMFFTRSDTPGVVVCGKGYPTFYARFFIRMMTETPLFVKVFACTDINPHGVRIIQNLTSPIGSRAISVNAPESELCKFENVWWAGPFPSDVVSKLSEDSESYDEEFAQQLQKWKSNGASNDEDTLQSFLSNKGSGSFVNQGASDERKIELELMHERQIKVEGEAFEEELIKLLHCRIGAAIREEVGWDGNQVK